MEEEVGAPRPGPAAARSPWRLMLVIGLGAVAVMGLYAAADGDAFARAFPNGHGLAAFLIGAVAAVGLSVGLFSLAYFSARRGHDAAVGRDDDAAAEADREA